MIKLGITGNIASGKTLVESFLQEEGINVIDADKTVHNLLDNDKEIIEQVYELFKSFGFDVRNEKGSISRKKAGEIVFKNKEILEKLENIIHPNVKKEIQKFFEINQDKKIVAAVVPLLYEAGMGTMFDYIITIIVNKDIQVERLMKRDNLTQEEAQTRINIQMSQEKKAKKANFVLSNNSSAEDLKYQLKEILSKI
ncbi:MAG: dephospho-CoA kinase [bacterium]